MAPDFADYGKPERWADGKTGNATHPLMAFSGGSYSDENMTAYNQAATHTLPLLTVLFANPSAGLDPWIDTRLTCLTPSRFGEGSVRPNGVAAVVEWSGAMPCRPSIATVSSLITFAATLLLF